MPAITAFAAQQSVLGVYGIVKFYGEMDLEKYMNFPLMVIMMQLLNGSFYPNYATIFEMTKNERINALRTARTSTRVAKQLETPRRPSNNEADMRIVRANENKERGLKEARAVARSYATIGVQFGSFYKIKRSTVLNIFDFLVCNSISALITYP